MEGVVSAILTMAIAELVTCGHRVLPPLRPPGEARRIRRRHLRIRRRHHPLPIAESKRPLRHPVPF